MDGCRDTGPSSREPTLAAYGGGLVRGQSRDVGRARADPRRERASTTSTVPRRRLDAAAVRARGGSATSTGRRSSTRSATSALDTLSWARPGARRRPRLLGPGRRGGARASREIGLDGRVRRGRRLRRRRGARRRASTSSTRASARSTGCRTSSAGHVMASLVAPGGFLYLAEFHPFTYVFADDDLTIEHQYFHAEPFVWPETAAPTPTPTRETVHNRTYEWSHTARRGRDRARRGRAADRVPARARLHAVRALAVPESAERRSFTQPEGMPSLPLMYSLRAIPRRQAA